MPFLSKSLREELIMIILMWRIANYEGSTASLPSSVAADIANMSDVGDSDGEDV